MSRFAFVSLLFCSIAYAADEIPFTAEQQRVLDVAVVGLGAPSSAAQARFAGKVVIPPKQERVSTAPVAGVVEEVLAAVGDVVTRGKALARVRSQELVEVQRAYLLAQSDDRLAQAALTRDEQLHKEGIIAERRYVETESRHDQTALALQGATQACHMAGIDDSQLVKLAETATPTTVVVVSAPFDGVVLEQRVTAGARVEKLDGLFRVARLDPLWVEAKVPLAKATALPTMATVRTAAPATSGTLLGLGREVDSDTQTVIVRFEINKGADKLRPGQIVDVEVSGATTGRFTVPRDAIARSGARAVVFVQRREGFAAVDVDVHSESNGNALISGKLDGSERVAVRGILALKGAWLGLGGEEQE